VLASGFPWIRGSPFFPAVLSHKSLRSQLERVFVIFAVVLMA
jgi:hypothetical protein